MFLFERGAEITDEVCPDAPSTFVPMLERRSRTPTGRW